MPATPTSSAKATIGHSRVNAMRPGLSGGRLVGEAGVANAMFGGDDRTDLDAFAVLRELEGEGELQRGICVGVASSEAPPEIESRADLMVAGPRGFLELLRSL